MDQKEMEQKIDKKEMEKKIDKKESEKKKIGRWTRRRWRRKR